MKSVLMILFAGVLLTSGCAYHGKGASSFNLKLHEESPYGDTLKGIIDPDGMTTLRLGKYVLEHNDIQRKEIPVINFEFEAGGVSVESCRLSKETEKGLHKLSEGMATPSFWDSHTYNVSFDTGMTMEALSEEVLVVTCNLIEDKAYLTAKAQVDTIPRDMWARMKEFFFGPRELDGGEHELEFEPRAKVTARR